MCFTSVKGVDGNDVGLLWLTSAVAGALSLPFHISGFLAAFWGAIIVGVVGWLLSVLIKEVEE